MYPVAEFRAVGLRRVRRGLVTALAALATLALLAVTALHLSDPWGPDRAARRIGLVWATLAAAGLTLLFEVGWKLARHPFTRCPHCRRRLTDGIPQVVASGCCPHCGRRVLEPPAEAPPADALVPRPEYIAADTGYQNRGVPVLIGGIIACYIGCGGAFASLDAFDLPFPLNEVVFVLLVLIAPVSLVAVLRWLHAGGRRNPALACPTCGRLLAGARMLVAATGNCHECGSRAIVPRTRPLPPPHLGPMWTVEGITERVRRRRKWHWRALGLTLTAGVLVPFAYPLGMWLVESAEPRLRLWLGWRGAEVVEENGPAAGTALAGAAVVVLVPRWVLRLSSRRHPLDCPRCGREFLPGFARATKCCNRCGWRIVAATSPSPSASG